MDGGAKSEEEGKSDLGDPFSGGGGEGGGDGRILGWKSRREAF